MKSFKPFILQLFVLIANTALGQSPNFMPLSHAQWSTQMEDGFGGYIYNYFRIPETQYDTIIGSNHYSKIYNIPGILQPESFLGAYRSDSSGKVFYITKGTTNEHLLMDFSAMEGDTVYDVIYNVIYYVNDTGFKVDFAVDSTGNITVGSRSYKCIFLSNKEVFPDEGGLNPLSLVWIEFFGCLNGGIFNYIGCTGFSPQRITCMSVKDTMYSNFSDCVNYYPLDNINFSVGNCVYPLSVEENSLTCSFFPNPASDFLDVKFNIPQKNVSVCIISYTGQVVKQQDIAVMSDYYSFDISDLPGGIYLVKISDDFDNTFSFSVTKL